MLFAGSGASINPAIGGALAFLVSSLPSWTDWSYGSAFMLVAGAGSNSTSSFGGALTFAMYGSPVWMYWGYGSAFF